MTTTPRKRLVNEVDRAFARAIVHFRTLAGLKQQDVAAQLGISHQQLQKYEQGLNRVTIGRAAEIAEILDVPLTVLIETASQPREWRVDRDAGRMLQAFQRISDKASRSQLVQLADHLARLSGTPSDWN